MFTAVCVLAWNDSFLIKTSNKIEKYSELSQNIWYLDKIKSFWKLMICFCLFNQKEKTNCFSFFKWNQKYLMKIDVQLKLNISRTKKDKTKRVTQLLCHNLLLEMTLFSKKTLPQNRKTFVTQSKHMIFW